MDTTEINKLRKVYNLNHIHFSTVKKIIYLPIVMDFGSLIKNKFKSREGIAFIGNYLHRPKFDEILFFFEEIFLKNKEVGT